MALKYRVFLHSYLGFNSNSTLIYGEKDAILIDPPQLMSDAHQMAAEIIRMRLNLTHIYCSHFHPDHHFGLKVLLPAFPDAKAVGLKQSVHDIIDSTNDKIDMWAIDRFGKYDILDKTNIPLILREPKLELEGEEIHFIGGFEGDSINNSIAWIPSIGVLCATDVAFHDCNLWPIESNVERRKKWRKDIARMMDYNPRVIIPGHHDEEKLEILKECAEDSSRTYTDCVQWSIDYLDHFDEVYATAKDGKEFYERIWNKYPLKAEDFAIHWATRLIFPQSCPDHLIQLPGKPGEIFLNPSGGFDGDTPKEEYVD
jgi:glyoxylase-like metal-dependent hydrolase (beta-lactamase superfamily II)